MADSHSRVRAVVLLLGLIGWSDSASAQESRRYVGGGLTMSPLAAQSVSEGSPSTTYVNTGPAKLVAGIVGEAGWFMLPSAAIGVEIAVPFQRYDLTQRFGYFTPYIRDARYREQTVFAVLRSRVKTTERVRIDLVAGGGAVRGSSRDRYASGTFGSAGFGPFGVETAVSHTALGLTAGADLELATARSITIVPRFRLVIVDRSDVTDSEGSFADLGLPTVIYRLGIGVRLRF